MRILSRWKDFRHRNEGSAFGGAAREIAARLWIAGRLSRWIGPLLPARVPDRWVFMGGCYNSGTTILREILGAHPEIATLPREGVRLTAAFPDLESDGWQRMWHRNAAKSQITPTDFQRMADRAKKDWSLWWRRRRPVFLEKSIIHAAWMTNLDEGFGDARFIGVVRNGFCASEGIRRRAKPFGKAQESLGSDRYPIAVAGQQWVHSNATLIAGRGTINHYLEVRYEDLVADPRATLDRICAFVGVAADKIKVEGNSVIVGPRRFTIRNDNPASLGRLTDQDRAEIIPVIGDMMRSLGYPV